MKDPTSKSEQYTADKIRLVDLHDSVYASLDLSQAAFKRRLQEAAASARDFTRT